MLRTHHVKWISKLCRCVFVFAFIYLFIFGFIWFCYCTKYQFNSVIAGSLFCLFVRALIAFISLSRSLALVPLKLTFMLSYTITISNYLKIFNIHWNCRIFCLRSLIAMNLRSEIHLTKKTAIRLNSKPHQDFRPHCCTADKFFCLDLKCKNSE